MPVIIDPTDFDRWLTDYEPPAELLKPYPADEMAAYPVSKEVNSPEKDEPSDDEKRSEDPQLDWPGVGRGIDRDIGVDFRQHI